MNSISSASGCPFAATAPKRDIAPCHQWLDKSDVHTPVPSVDAAAWKDAKHYDAVVVGAGMGGLYTAAKLQDKMKVAVFERTHHIGGRARSDRVDGAGVPFDLGAMRYIPSQHVLVNGLVDQYKIPTHPFVVGGDKNLQYFRGVRLTNEEVAKDPTKLPFNLAPSERGKTADELLGMAIESVVPHFRQLTAQQWEDAKRNTSLPFTDPSTGETKQVPLYQLGLQNVLARTLSREAQALVMDSVGYQSFLSNWDAGQALQGIAGDFRPGTEYRTPDDGMKAFPKALANDLKQHGTEMHTETTLRQVNWDAQQKHFYLVFQDGEGKAVPVVADKVVLDLPKVPLQALVQDSPALQSTPLESNLGKVTANPMSRIFITYDKPWWHDDGIQSGRSLTDLQLGQVYYYDRPGDTRPYVQVYADGANSEYWEGLENPANPGVTTRLCATPQLAAELQHQLEELHGHPLPAPNGFLYKRWADPFLGAAYHTWNAGSQPGQTADAMVQPIQNLPLYVCGEAFSTQQGWIEGALQQAQKVVGKLS